MHMGMAFLSLHAYINDTLGMPHFHSPSTGFLENTITAGKGAWMCISERYAIFVYKKKVNQLHSVIINRDINEHLLLLSVVR